MFHHLPFHLSIALTHLNNRKRQSFVSIFGVAMGVGFFIAIAALMQGFQTYFVQKIIDVSPHITIQDEFRTPKKQAVELHFPNAKIQLDNLKPKDEVRGIKNHQQILSFLKSKPGISASPSLNTQVFLTYGSKEISSTLIGILPEEEKRSSTLERDLINGTLDDLHTTPNGIILGEGLAEKLGARLFSKLSVTSPQGVVMNMKVVGVLQTGITSIDNFQSYALLKKAQVLADKINIVNEIRLKLSNIEQAEPMARILENRFRYRAESWEETNQNVLGIFVIQNGIMYSTTGAILIVAAFGIFNIISTIINEKKKDIAILKSMGFGQGDILKIFFIEGIIVGIIGAILGWLVGFGLTEFLDSIEMKMEGFVKSNDGFILHRSIWHYVIASIVAIGASTLAALIPARKAATVKPVDIIRGNG